MTVFRRWDVVKIPLGEGEQRPALVIVAGEIFRLHGLLWVLMITSAKNRGWPGDIEIADIISAGLGVPSIIRTAKIMTIEGREAYVIGSLLGPERKAVGERVFENMGLMGVA